MTDSPIQQISSSDNSADDEEYEIPEEFDQLVQSVFDGFRGEEEDDEKFTEFLNLAAGLAKAMGPVDTLDWQIFADVLETAHELFILRKTKQALNAEARGSAVEALMRRKVLETMPVAGKMAAIQAQQSAMEWRGHPEKRAGMEAGLARYSSDPENAIRVQALEQRRVLFGYLDELFASAQKRRGMLLHQYYGRREVVRRALEAAQRWEEEKLKMLPASVPLT